MLFLMVVWVSDGGVGLWWWCGFLMVVWISGSDGSDEGGGSDDVVRLVVVLS